MSALSIKNNKSMVPIKEDTASVGVKRESIATTGVPEKCVKTVTGPNVDLNPTLCTSVLGLAHDAFLCGA